MLKRTAIIIFLLMGILLPFVAAGEEINDLKSRITKKNNQIAEIEREITGYLNEIERTEKEANTLGNQIKRISATVSKLSGDIRLTRRRIEAAELALEKLGEEIGDKEDATEVLKRALAELIRNFNETQSKTLLEILLAYPTFSSFFSDLEYIENLGAGIDLKLSDLREVKKTLTTEKKEKGRQKKRLIYLREELADRKVIEEGARRQKKILLSVTKNKETQYKKLLSERLAKKDALEAEIRKIEEELRITIDPDSLPKTGSGVLAWPLDKVKITQYFGNTRFSTRNPQIYNGKGHNGIDLRASFGTPIKTALAGKVSAIGNTDKTCYKVSYGKWILIDHGNNLSTLYSHLSFIKVASGASVKKGETIGYSGNTGYTTGPHLHFAVFATQGVRISTIRSKICGTLMRLPVAPYSAYLNPLSYL
ncbi:peptidoglycan DD-metalloendopeptidase family protein [Patescibacteria group bacterium]|nr:peptidoglycan DD-metalloendopeptidase family protein [Patescibacteria group bacterium]